MQKAYIFIDETGKPDESDHSKYFCLSAIVINDKNRLLLKTSLENLKQRYFGSKGYVIHGSEVKRDLRYKKKDEAKFAKDFKKIVMPIGFFSLCTITNKKQAYKGGWLKKTILEKSYRAILDNLIKFVIAKNYRGQIITEASAHEQDIHLYKNFFHFLANGIPEAKINTEDVKKHVTSVMYVTKQNEDCETQLVDLLAGVIETKHKIDKGEIKRDEVNAFDSEMLKILDNKLFISNANGKDARKKELYEVITAYKKFP